MALLLREARRPWAQLQRVRQAVLRQVFRERLALWELSGMAQAGLLQRRPAVWAHWQR